MKTCQWSLSFQIMTAAVPGDDTTRFGAVEGDHVTSESESARGRGGGNRLAAEKSPYLLQHAHNPVDWYPWGDEAFAEARRSDRPIFLSIGYSTCHWCHVMERESFESDEVAAELNRDFVSIKVDREERPDVDRVYMATVQALTGSGGWPLSVWLTPELEPFYAGTYFPPDGRYGRPGFLQVLSELARIWREERQKAVSSAQHLVQALRQQSASAGSAPAVGLEPRWVAAGAEAIAASADRRLGGFGSAPKFPRPATLFALLREHARSGAEAPLEIVRETLLAMWAGGVYDHLGGGLHRYSVDAHWRVPHFEKMLYDQAQLVMALVEAQQASGDERFGAIATEVIDYVRRDLTSPEGAFYSAEDADSASDPRRPEEREEGAFYLWEKAEVEELLGPDDGELFALAYGVSEVGNTLNDPHGELGTRNVLYRALDPEALALRVSREREQIEARLADCRRRLFEARGRRPRPHLDDKVLTGWNGLMISACARAHQLVGRRRDLVSAQCAAELLRRSLWDEDAQALSRRLREGEVRFAAQLDDYAFLTQGLIDLWEADFDPGWLEWAERLVERALEIFDGGPGALYDSVEDSSVLVRMRELYDGAEPSGNAVTALNLQRLASILDRPLWRVRAEQILRATAGHLEKAPQAVPQGLVALDFFVGESMQVVITGAPADPLAEALLRVVRRSFTPRKIVLRLDGGAAEAFLATRQPFVAAMAGSTAVAAAHVCRDYTCELPTSDPDQLVRQLAAPHG
jgi:uncharacterized protein YyaL (SSP411 family)